MPTSRADAAKLMTMRPAVTASIPAPEKPPLSDAERARRLALLVERLNRPDGLDRATLARIEQLSDE